MYSRSAKGGKKRDPNRNPWLAKMVFIIQKCFDYMSTCKMAGVLRKARTAYLLRAPNYTPVFGGVNVAHFKSFLCCPIMCLYALISL